MGIHGHDKIFQTVLVKRGVKKFAQPDFSRIHFRSAVSYVYVSACCILVCICVFTGDLQLKQSSTKWIDFGNLQATAELLLKQ